MFANIPPLTFSSPPLSGFYQHGGVSISTFVSWISEICYISENCALYPCQPNNNRDIGGPALDSSSALEIQPGRYVIRSPKSAQVCVFLTSDLPRPRTYSVDFTHSPHDSTNFVTRVRNRDKRCCITGHLVAGGDFTGFEAAHIYPLSAADIQGFLCSSTEHRMFDDYAIAVNPDDNYRIYDFVGRDPNRTPHGKIFYRDVNQPQIYLPSPDLLRDHFRQCILRYVKGAGEGNDHRKPFDPDLNLGAGRFNLESGGWWSSPEGKKQLEAELAERLYRTSEKHLRMSATEFARYSLLEH
ncbi:hypothetical protein PILCRDRAFT_7081 [Piloderma croceum F 1598]|uniref:HNH nuclease domain-containing protein n=1 Tax=Piloderma croceum (strain F 1598) TaxID=765440 RepID=A0A0C3FVY2_PILCF|nr:hypothetical protein PILCRDRAFT_7081 [Piloderma croceum F 1598]